MIGAIIGDIVGSVYEFNNIRTKNFPLITNKNTFTDDTIMTIAIMDWLIHNKNGSPVPYMKKWGRKYPSSYGGRFGLWLKEENPEPYYSFGNGSAMRISPVAYVSKNLKELEELVIKATVVTHDHPEGIKGAMVTATCIYMALHGGTKKEIKNYVLTQYPEIQNFDYEDLRRNYWFDESCQNTVPQAIYCFLISENFIDCVRTTISIGGDCDTTSAISCAIADAFYGSEKSLTEKCMKKLTKEMRETIQEFENLIEQG